jgi:hypothetical protein
MGLGWWTRPGNKKKLDGVSSAAVLSDGYAPSQKNLNLNRKRMTATKAKAAAINPATIQNPFGLPLNGMPPTFVPQMLAISVAGRNITENIVIM